MKFSKDNVSDCEEIFSTQEEADTRIILQSMFVNQQMVKRNSNATACLLQHMYQHQN
jgi:hypothetical protein